MTIVQITGYKKIEKNGKTFYMVYAIDTDSSKGVEGLATYSEFVSKEHLEKHKIAETELVGTLAETYNVKEGNTWKSGITFKNSKKGAN